MGIGASSTGADLCFVRGYWVYQCGNRASDGDDDNDKTPPISVSNEYGAGV
jgi:hypothetical protein